MFFLSFFFPKKTFVFTMLATLSSPSGKVEENCINLASYNYLGFAETRGQCIEDVCKSLRSYSISTCGAARDLGFIISVFIHIFRKDSGSDISMYICLYVYGQATRICTVN